MSRVRAPVLHLPEVTKKPKRVKVVLWPRPKETDAQRQRREKTLRLLLQAQEQTTLQHWKKP